MRFTIPQFIEHEAKIIGPFTFKQFVYVALAGAACFIIYFTSSFTAFVIACIFLIGGSLAVAFITIGGRSLPAIIGNMLKFSVSPKVYIWKKKNKAEVVFKKEIHIKNEEIPEDEMPLKISKESQLKKLSTQIETQSK